MLGLDHLDLVVRSLERSLPFYRELLEPLGYVRESPIDGEQGERVVYLGRPAPAMGSVSLREATSGEEVDRYRLGSVHHVAFGAASREQVDERAGWLRARGVEIESGPREYDYTPGYYAVFFRDPDGIKLEILHRPRVFREPLVLFDQPASANCLKVRIALRQLGAPYERVEIDIFRGEARTDEHLARNPAGRTPVLEVGGRALPESGAILTWLAERSSLLPDDPWQRAQVLRWLLFEQSSIEPWIAVPRFLALSGNDRGEVEAMKPRGADALKSLERGLAASGPFLLGETYTIADIANYGYVHVAADAGHDLAGYPAIVAWLARVEATPGFVNDLTAIPGDSQLPR
jgi:glutathione S-transferase